MRFSDDELALVRTTVANVLATSAPADVPAALVAEGVRDLLDADPVATFIALGEEVGFARSPAPVVDLAVMWGGGVPIDPATGVIVDGLVVAGAGRATDFISITDDGFEVYGADAVSGTPAGGLDPSFALERVTLTGPGRRVPADIPRAVAAGRLLLASQMVGASDRMLGDTLGYIKERRQYGRPIGSFQSVKHRMAEVKVAVGAARASVAAAWEAVDSRDATTLAMAVKCLAGRAQQLASTHCFQVHGGIAFTVEHGFQDWVRRGMMLDLLLGGHEQLTTELGRRLIAAGEIPRVPALF